MAVTKQMIPGMQQRGPSLLEISNKGYRAIQDIGAVLRLLEQEIEGLHAQVQRLTAENAELKKSTETTVAESQSGA